MPGLDPIWRWFGRQTVPERSWADLPLARADVAELSRIGRQVAADYGFSSPVVIRSNLARLVSRRVPVRAIRRGGAEQVGALCFADGTVVLVRGQHAGDLGRLAVRALHQQLTFEDFHADSDQLIIELAGPHERLSVVAVGLEPAA